MIKVVTIALFAVLFANAARAEKSNDPVWACNEAADSSLKANVPQKFRAKVIAACKAAFADQDHWKHIEAACNAQGAKFNKKDERGAVVYTCMSAMILTYIEG